MTDREFDYILDHQDWIISHLKEDPAQLALKYSKDPDTRLLISQIGWRQKLRKKVPDFFEKVPLIIPSALSTEQASSAATAKLKAKLIKGEKLLDITGGLGIDCFYLSTSFRKAEYYEQDQLLARVATVNLRESSRPIAIHHGDGLKALSHSDADVVYVDPYRRDTEKNRVQSLSESTPDVTQVAEELTANGRRSLIKASPMYDLDQAQRELPYLSEIWTISLRNDCKEVIYLLKRDDSRTEAKLRCFNISATGLEEAEGLWTDRSLQAETAMPSRYLYEANSAVMKAGLQNKVAVDLGLKKLHPQSNFFTSDELVQAFPGKCFALQSIQKAFDKKFKKGRFNVIARNFPQKASEIERKLKLKPHHQNYLLATRLKDESLAFLEVALKVS